MTDIQCEACGDFFKRVKKGYNRYGATRQVNGRSIQSLLEQYSIPRQASGGKAFVCSACFSQLRTITKHEAMFLEGVQRKVGPAFMDTATDIGSWLKMGGRRRPQVDHKKLKNTTRNCATCGKEFQYKQKSYRRFGVSHLIGEQTFADILLEKFSLHITKTSFVCGSCYSTLVNFLKYEKKVRQKIGIQTEESTQPGEETGANIQPLVQAREERERYHFLQDVSFYEALLFLEDVILKYWETPDTVIQLLEILSKLRLGVYGPKVAQAKVKDLCDSSEDMLLGFNIFLPPRHHYEPDPEKNIDKSIDPDHISETVELQEETENDDHLEKEIVNSEEKENQSEKKKEHKQQKTFYKRKKTKIGYKGKGRKVKDNAEMKLHDVTVKIENMDDMTKEDENEQSSQDIVNEKQSSAENVSIESWTLLDDFGAEITISENKFDNSMIESDNENFEQENQKSLDRDEHCTPAMPNIADVPQHLSTSQNVGLQSGATLLVKPKETVKYVLPKDLSRLHSKSVSYVLTKDNALSTLYPTSQKEGVPTTSCVKPKVINASSQLSIGSQNFSTSTNVGLQSSSTSLMNSKVTVTDVLAKYQTHPVLDTTSSNVCLQSSSALPNTGVTLIYGSQSGDTVWQSGNKAASLMNKDHSEEEVYERKGATCTVNLVKSKGKDLGFSLAKAPLGEGFYVQKIYGFPAILHKKLSEGDQLIKINGVIIKNMDLRYVERFILNQEGCVSLQVCHFETKKREIKPSSVFTPTPPALARIPPLATTHVLATTLASAPMPVLTPMPVLAPMPVLTPMPVLAPMPGLALTPTSAPMQVLGIESLLAGSHVLLPSNPPKLVPVSMLSTMSSTPSAPSTSMQVLQGSSAQLTPSTTVSKMLDKSSSALMTQASSTSLKTIMPHQFMTPLSKQLKLSPVLTQSKTTILLTQSSSTPMLTQSKTTPMLSLLTRSSSRPMLTQSTSTALLTQSTSTPMLTQTLLTQSSSAPMLTQSTAPISVAPVLQHGNGKVTLRLPKGLEMPSLVPKLNETPGSSQVSPAVKTSFQLSDVSKKQLLESLSKSIVNNEAILTDTVGIKCKMGKLKEIEQKADGQEKLEFEAASSSSVCIEPTQLSDSSFRVPSLPISKSQTSISTLLTVSSSNFAGTPVLTPGSKTFVASLSTLAGSDIPANTFVTSKHTETQGLSKVPPVVKTSQQHSDVSKKQLLKSISKSITKNEAILMEELGSQLRKEGKTTGVNQGTVQNSTPVVITNKFMKSEQFNSREIQVSDMKQSRSAIEERSLATIKPKPSSSITYIKTEKPKHDTTKSSKNELQLVDIQRQIDSTDLAENTRKTLMKAAMDLVNKTKQSNPELQTFKLSFLKSNDLDNQNMHNDTNTSAVESMDTESSSTTETQDGYPRKSTTRRLEPDDYHYFKDVRMKKEKAALLKREREKKRLQKIQKSKEMTSTKERLNVATAKRGSENEMKEALTESVMETSIAQPNELEETDTAESDNGEFTNSYVLPDLSKAENIIELDHPYTGTTAVTSRSPRQSDSALMKPKLEKMDPEMSSVSEASRVDNENPMSPSPSSDFLQAIQMSKLEFPETDSAKVVDSGKPVAKTDRAKNAQLDASQSNLKSFRRGKPVPQAIRTSMRLSDRARRRKLRLIEEDEIVPKKRQKGVKPIVKPVTKPVPPVRPDNCCVHCFRAFLLNRSAKISLTEYMKTDDGKREVLLGTFLKYEVAAEYVNPRWCLCQVCYNLCEKIQKWRERYLGSKESLEVAETEFQKRKNNKALLYTKGGKRQEPAVLSERNDDQHLKEVAKHRCIALVSKKIGGLQHGTPLGAYKARLIQDIYTSKYKSLIQHIAKHGKKGKRDVLEVVKRIVRQEIRDHIKRRDSVLQYKGLEDIERFSWIAVIQEFSALPFVSGIIMAMLTKSNREIHKGKFSTENTKTVEREYGIAFGVLVSVLFYFRNPRRFNTFQVINSIQMYDKGCLKQLYHLFWQVGFCLSGKERIVKHVTQWTNERLGMTGPPKQVNAVATGSSNTADEEMEVPYRYDHDENEEDETNEDLQQGGQSQLRENGESEHLTAEETVSNEELRQALGTIGSFEKITQGDPQEDEDMDGGNQVQYIAEETGQYATVFENFGVETVHDDKTDSFVMEVDGNQTDAYQDSGEDGNTEVTVKIKSVGEDGTIELDYDGQDGTELHSLDEWMRIFASKSK